MTIIITRIEKKELYEKVKDLDVYELMLLSIMDHADWLVTEYIKTCREIAEEKSRESKIDYSTLFNQCLYESRKEVEKMLYSYIHDVYDATIMLFGIFYNYELPVNHELNRKIEEIVQETLKTLTPKEPKV